MAPSPKPAAKQPLHPYYPTHPHANTHTHPFPAHAASHPASSSSSSSSGVVVTPGGGGGAGGGTATSSTTTTMTSPQRHHQHQHYYPLPPAAVSPSLRHAQPLFSGAAAAVTPGTPSSSTPSSSATPVTTATGSGSALGSGSGSPAPPTRRNTASASVRLAAAANAANAAAASNADAGSSSSTSGSPLQTPVMRYQGLPGLGGGGGSTLGQMTTGGGGGGTSSSSGGASRASSSGGGGGSGSASPAYRVGGGGAPSPSIGAAGAAGKPRSRRSSVALATSVSLASRERSRTPVDHLIASSATGGVNAAATPPVSPGAGRREYMVSLGDATAAASASTAAGRRSKRSSREYSTAAGAAAIELGVDAVREESESSDQGHTGGTGTSGSNSFTIDERLLNNKIRGKRPAGGMSGSGFEFADFGWEEAFEDDDEDVGSLTGGFQGGGVKSDADLDSEVDRTSVLIDGLSVEGRHSSSGDRTSLYQRLRVSRPGSKHSSYGLPTGTPSSTDDETVFRRGERFGAGLPLRGEVVEHVDPTSAGRPVNGRPLPASLLARNAAGLTTAPPIASAVSSNKIFEVVRKLGSGSYANVYLVREVSGGAGGGQEFALKCLSKQDLEQDSLDVQLFEATIHLCLPKHENIVTLYQTLQTRRWLFLLMEMCPGEDLFYWLEHSRDSPPDTAAEEDAMSVVDDRPVPLSSSQLPSSAIPYSSSAILSGMGGGAGSSLALSQSPAFAFSKSHLSHEMHNNGHTGTPTTPSLLSAYSAKTLLSTRRLKLIASMFGQMCEAVALCHDAGISHRDIKPENFICCDSEELAATRDDDEIARYEKRKVIVKLTDFGLATTEENSCDVECGSRPYMAYECRNELGPSYAPKPADVWSLGVVLLNMLFHRNPWTDPIPGNKNFDGFLDDPVDFLLTRFTGIGREVATYLAERVFTMNVDVRVGARDFGVWSRDLPIMIGGRKAVSALRLNHLQNGPGGKDSINFAKSPIHPKGMSSALANGASNLTSSAPNQSNGQHRQYASNESEIEERHAALPPEITVEQAYDAEAPNTDSPTPAAVDDAEDAEHDDAEHDGEGQDDATRAASGIKRKKRGVRKGKAAKAAAKALLEGIDTGKPLLPPPAPKEAPKDEVLADLAEASEHLAREISSVNKEFVVDLSDFPKIGELPPAEIKKSRWKQLISATSGNPELQALARKVQEKEAQSNKSAPARLQQHRSTVSVTPSLSHTSSTVSQTTSYQASPHPPVPAALEAESWRSTEESRGRAPQIPPRDAADHGRYEVSPVPSLVSSRAGSTYTPSLYSLATVQTRSTVSTSRSSESIPSRHWHPKGPPPPKGFPKSNVKLMTGIPWELDCLPRQARIDRNGNMPEGDIFSKPPVRKPKPPKASKLAPIAETAAGGPAASSSTAGSAGGFTPISKTSSITSQRSERSQSSLLGSSNSPPTKLKMQMAASLGKMFGGLKKNGRD